jgi:hypothetical protein
MRTQSWTPSPEIFPGGAESTYPGSLRAWCGSMRDRTPPHPVRLRPQDVLRGTSYLLPSGTPLRLVVATALSMNPLSLEGTTMVPTSLTRIRTFFRPRKESAPHPEALQERHLTLPRRIDDPASAASTARALLCNRREDVTLVLYMDDRHRFVGHAVVAVGWVQASRSLPARWSWGPRPARQTAASLSDMAATGRFTPRKRRLPPSVPSPMQRPVTGLLSWTTWWWSRERAQLDHLPSAVSRFRPA